MNTLDNIVSHTRDREYMSGVDRDKSRVKSTGEVFTPTPLVQEVLDQLDTDLYTDSEKTFLDPSCGDGQFLSEILIRKVESGIDFEEALKTIYGVDLMPDNVKLCQDRLLCGREDLRHIVEQNIVCADGVKYHYRFDGTPPYSMTIDEYEAELERHRAEKHQMHKKVGGYRTEIAKLTERVRALEAQLKEQDIKKDIMASNGIDVVTS